MSNPLGQLQTCARAPVLVKSRRRHEGGVGVDQVVRKKLVVLCLVFFFSLSTPGLLRSECNFTQLRCNGVGRARVSGFESKRGGAQNCSANAIIQFGSVMCASGRCRHRGECVLSVRALLQCVWTDWTTFASSEQMRVRSD